MALNARARRDIRECAVTIVAVKRIARPNRASASGQQAAVHKINILVTVTIEVEERATGPHRFQEELLSCGRILVAKLDTRTRADVREFKVRSRRRDLSGCG